MSCLAKPRVLIVAPNVSARFGGEAILPLNYFRLLTRRGYVVHLLAHERNRQELQTLAEFDPARVHFIPDTRWHRLALRAFSGTVLLSTMMTALNEVFQSRVIARLVRDREIDLIHQTTPVSPAIPNRLHRFGLPLVIGPMNGAIDYPPDYHGGGGAARRRVKDAARFGLRMMNHLMRGKLNASLLLVANERTRAALPDPNHPRIRMLVENGVDLDRWQSPPSMRQATGEGAGQLRLVFLGRLVDWKAVDITLEAVALARASGAKVTLDVIGDGPERAALVSLAQELHLGDHVRFHGFVPQERCAAVIGQADALVLNSLCECGGAVVLEAMAMGLPVVASAWGGPLDYLDERSGILVDPSPRASFPGRLAEAFAKLAGDPDRRRRMGAEGQRVVRERFDWQAKIDQMIVYYHEALSVAKPQPSRTVPASGKTS